MKLASVLFHCSSPFVLLGGTLAGLAAGSYFDGGGSAAVLAAAAAVGVDQSTVITARNLAAQAHGAEERQKAAEAVQVANHSVDQAFDKALRDENADASPLKGEALETSQKIAALAKTVEEEKQHVVALTTARLKTASQNDVAQLGEQAQEQLDLDTDKLDELHRDLILLGGEKQAGIQRAIEEQDALQEQPIVSSSSENDLESSQNLATLPGKVRAFLQLRGREKQLRDAGEEATTTAALLTQEKRALEHEAKPLPLSVAGTVWAADGQQASGPQQATMEYDGRIHDQQQLGAIYGSWAEITRAKRVRVQHGILRALAILVAIFVAAPFGMVLIRREFARKVEDKRRAGRYPVIAGLVLEVLALAMILIVMFGTPIHMPVVAGL